MGHFSVGGIKKTRVVQSRITYFGGTLRPVQNLTGEVTVQTPSNRDEKTRSGDGVGFDFLPNFLSPRPGWKPM